MNDLTVFDTIMIWDKIMDTEERGYLIENYMEFDKENDSKKQSFDQTVIMHAENMNDEHLDNLHSAMILSPKTKFYQKKLATIEQNIEKLWNSLTCCFWNHTDQRAQGTSFSKFMEDILPNNIIAENLTRKYNELSFTVKHILRASYNPKINRFEPLRVFGRYNEELGICNE